MIFTKIHTRRGAQRRVRRLSVQRLSMLALVAGGFTMTGATVAADARGQGVDSSSPLLLQSRCQDETAIITIGKQLYTFGTIHTKQVDSGDLGSDANGNAHIDRDILLVPITRRPVNFEDRNIDSPTVSPSKIYLAFGWRVIHGVNGMALYKLLGKQNAGNLRYTLVTGKLAPRIARGIQPDGDDERMGEGWMVSVRGWRGAGDRYLVFDEYALHSPDEVARGTYDVRTGKIRIDPEPKFGNNDPRLPGEKYPQTRQQAMSVDEINEMGFAQVRYAINEIYARYGRVYDDDKHNSIYKQFQQFDWFRAGDGYRKVSVVESGLSEIERANLKSLKARRNKLLGKPADWKADWETDD